MIASPVILQSAARSVQARKRIFPFIRNTPLLTTRNKKFDKRLFFKAENYQETGSFKIRGAVSKLTALECGGKAITASSGNHGIAVAQAASLLGYSVAVVLPESVTQVKLDQIRDLKVDVRIHGRDAGFAERYAAKVAKEENFTYISPYNDLDVIAGQGTIGIELIESLPRIDRVFIAMGGGGLIGGIASVLKSFSPQTRVVGVAARNSMALAVSMKAGRVVETEHLDTLADGVAGGIDENALTLELAMLAVDDVVVCDEIEILEAMRELLLVERMLVEGASALAYAGFLKSFLSNSITNDVVVLCGGNVDSKKILPTLL